MPHLKSSRKHSKSCKRACDSKYNGSHTVHGLESPSSVDAVSISSVDYKDDLLDIDSINVGINPRVTTHSASHLAHHTVCDVPTFTACLNEKLKQTKVARRKDHLQFQMNLGQRKKQVSRLKGEVNQAQDLVKEYSNLTEQLTNELSQVKHEAKHKIKVGGKKYDAMTTRCTDINNRLSATQSALQIARAQHQEGITILDCELQKLKTELSDTRDLAERNGELAKLRAVEIERGNMKQQTLLARGDHLERNLHNTASQLRQCQVARKIAEDELNVVRVELERYKGISEKLQAKVYNLKTELADSNSLKHREKMVSTANTHYRNMLPYLGIIFVTEPWPVSSTHGTGTLLQKVKKGGSAHSSGLRKGDVITEVNGKPTRSKTEFYASMYGVKPGDILHMHIIRPSQGPGIVRAIDVQMGASGYTLKQVLALRRLAERDASVDDVEFEVDCTLSGIKPQ